MAVSEDVRAYYAGFAEREWTRLERAADGEIEFVVTCAALERYLPPSGRVLDVGGGPGRYTLWLAERGYRVTLADLSPALLAIAQQRIGSASPEVGERVEAIVEADARDLSAWTAGAFDAVLCLGPFYHLPAPSDQAQVAAELRRVLAPGGVVFAALMPRLAFVRRSLSLPDERRHLLEPDFLERVLDEGVFLNDVPGRFTQGAGVEPSAVGPFFAGCGFESLALLSAESLTVGLESELPALLGDPALAPLVRQLAVEHAVDPSLLGLARHLLYVGRRRWLVAGGSRRRTAAGGR